MMQLGAGCARTAGFTADGLFEGAAPGGEYETKCVLCPRSKDLWILLLCAILFYAVLFYATV